MWAQQDPRSHVEEGNEVATTGGPTGDPVSEEVAVARTQGPRDKRSTVKRWVADNRVEPTMCVHLGKLERPVERVAVVPNDLGHFTNRTAALDEPAVGEPPQLRPRRHPVKPGCLMIDHRPHPTGDLSRGERVGAIEPRQRRASDHVAEQSGVIERGVGFTEELGLALGVGDVTNDEGLEVAA